MGRTVGDTQNSRSDKEPERRVFWRSRWFWIPAGFAIVLGLVSLVMSTFVLARGANRPSWMSAHQILFSAWMLVVGLNGVRPSYIVERDRVGILRAGVWRTWIDRSQIVSADHDGYWISIRLTGSRKPMQLFEGAVRDADRPALMAALNSTTLEGLFE